MYKKTSCISRLPSYLTVQFVRFFVGRAPDSEEVVSKKILKVCVCVLLLGGACVYMCELNVVVVLYTIILFILPPFLSHPSPTLSHPSPPSLSLSGCKVHYET